MLNRLVADQRVQMESDRIRMHIKYFGYLNDAHRAGPRLEHPQHITTTAGRFLTWHRDRAHNRRESCLRRLTIADHG